MSNTIDPTKIKKDNIPVTNNNNLFTLVTENIILDGSNFNSSNTSLILCGKYVAMYNDNSSLSLSGSGYLKNILCIWKHTFINSRYDWFKRILY
jgi:hypothetical protein